jgi:hypothetical protein
MATEAKVRRGWLKAMYLYTIVGAGVLGLAMIVAPDFVRSTFGWPDQDPIVFGICGSFYLASGLVSILGLRSPLKFAPILLVQLAYKSVWFIGVILPLLLAGRFPPYAVVYVVIFATYVIGDLIAVPFPYVFAKEDAGNPAK